MDVTLVEDLITMQENIQSVAAAVVVAQQLVGVLASVRGHGYDFPPRYIIGWEDTCTRNKFHPACVMCTITRLNLLMGVCPHTDFAA